MTSVTGFKNLQLAISSAQVEIEVPLADTTVRVKPPMDWPTDVVQSINQGDFTAWAQAALVPEDVATWNKVRPTFRQVLAFFAEYEKLAGENPEK